jgi:hypothetical protein
MKRFLVITCFVSICAGAPRATSWEAFASPPAEGGGEVSPTAPLAPGTLTSADRTDAWKVENALSAAPPAIADKATVRDWPRDREGQALAEGRVLRQGTNGWTCMPDRPGMPQHDPMCMDETMMKWMTAVVAHQPPRIDRVGLSYMLLGEARADPDDIMATQPPPGKNWAYVGPHVMVVLPDTCRDALRYVNRDISKDEPYVTALDSTSPLWVIPVAQADERLRAHRP